MPGGKSHILLYRTEIGVIVVASQRPDRVRSVKGAGVSAGSYAAELVERFHYFLVGRATDLKREYANYYASEYADLEQFLYRRYCLSAKWLKTLNTAIEEDAFVGLVKSEWGRDWLIENLIECDETYNIVAKAIGAEWVDTKNED